MGLLLATIARAISTARLNARRLDKGVPWMQGPGCGYRWRHRSSSNGGQIHLLGKGRKARTVQCPVTRSNPPVLGAAKRQLCISESRERGTSHSTGDWRCLSKWAGQQDFTSIHQLRHSHTTRCKRGVDVFTLQATLGHSSTIGDYVASNAQDGGAGSAY